MTDKPSYRWERRRAARKRKERLSGGISSHDFVILAVIMAMLVIVIRIVFIFGSSQGMEIGPFTQADYLRDVRPLPYADLTVVTDSFHELKFISSALFLYWTFSSWRSLASPMVSLSTKTFKTTLGVTILLLVASSFFPEHALFLAEVWFDPVIRPLMKI